MNYPINPTSYLQHVAHSGADSFDRIVPLKRWSPFSIMLAWAFERLSVKRSPTRYYRSYFFYQSASRILGVGPMPITRVGTSYFCSHRFPLGATSVRYAFSSPVGAR